MEEPEVLRAHLNQPLLRGPTGGEPVSLQAPAQSSPCPLILEKPAGITRVSLKGEGKAESSLALAHGLLVVGVGGRTHLGS